MPSSALGIELSEGRTAAYDAEFSRDGKVVSRQQVSVNLAS